MAYSTIPAAKAQLVDTTLPARAGLTGVLIAWGVPMDESSANRERVYVGDATGIQREWAQLGRYRVDEDYLLPIYVEVYQEGDAQRTCEERMWAIVAEIEQAAVVDITLAGTLKWGVKPGPMDPKTFPYGDGWIAQVTVSLECSSRLQAT